MPRLFMIGLFTLALTSLGYSDTDSSTPAEEAVPVEAVEVEQVPADETTMPAEPTAEDVLEEMIRRRQDNVLIEPATSPSEPSETPAASAETTPAAPAATVTPVPRATGIAPEVERVTSEREEGQFIMTRRARMIRDSAGAWMIVFESDRDGLADPPMYLMPCRLLERAESVFAEQTHSDSIVFLVSGEVFRYHGTSYLLPTLLRPDRSRNNLQP